MLAKITYWIAKTGLKYISDKTRAEGWLMFWTGGRYYFQPDDMPEDDGTIIDIVKELNNSHEGSEP